MISGPWDASQIQSWLSTTVSPLRLACVRTNGYPAIVSLWFVLRDDVLWCATQRDAALVRMLERAGKCGFEVATNSMPYCGVRGFGDAAIVPEAGDEILSELVDRYAIQRDSKFGAWLLSREREEVAIAITPVELQSWDYRKRMAS